MLTGLIAAAVRLFKVPPEIAGQPASWLPGPISSAVQWLLRSTAAWTEAWQAAVLYLTTAAGLFWVMGKPAHYLAAHYFAPYPTFLKPLAKERRSGLNSGDAALPLVGREVSLERLQRFARAPMPVAWQLLIGPAGTGKSRLAEEFGRIAACLDAPRRSLLRRSWVALHV